MILLYAFLLMHIKSNSKNMWLYIVVGLLIVYNFSLIGWGAMATRLFVKGHRTETDVILFGFFVGMTAASFNTAHYMIADKY